MDELAVPDVCDTTGALGAAADGGDVGSRAPRSRRERGKADSGDAEQRDTSQVDGRGDDADSGDDATANTEAAARASVMDRHVGARIRERRVMLGISQQQLARTVGVTYQQAHKYERGLNRVSAGRLHEIAVALAVPITWFFEGVDDSPGQDPSARQRMCLELARNFSSIENERHQLALSQLARALASSGSEDEP